MAARGKPRMHGLGSRPGKSRAAYFSELRARGMPPDMRREARAGSRFYAAKA